MIILKKIMRFISLIIIIFTLSGCFKDDKLENSKVYTTIYPITYLTDKLYKNTKNISSIYPNGADIKTYELTNKQKEIYSKGALFIYNGLTSEKELAREFLNNNKKIQLIDVSYGLNYEDSLEELWLSPNNYLMLAKNIKNNLLEYTTSKVLKESIENNYKELQTELSFMDANLREIGSNALMDGNPIIISSSKKLNFLTKYGFQVYNLDSDTINIDTIKNGFKNSKYKDLYLCDNDPKTDLINDLENNYKANIIKVNVMNTLTDKDIEEQNNYKTIMEDFIENIRNTALS